MQAPIARRQSVDRAERGDRGHQYCMEGTWRNIREGAQRESSERKSEERTRRDKRRERVEKEYTHATTRA
eukprot:1121167-Rhodomonas_salina.1